MARDDEVKTLMVKALRMAKECMVDAGMTLAYPIPGVDPSLTPAAILAVEIFRQLESPTGSKQLLAPLGE